MWKMLTAFTVAAFLTTPAFAQAEGTWTGNIPPPTGAMVTAKFKVDEFKVTGTMTFGDEQPVEISDGQLVQSQVSFAVTRGGQTDRYTGEVKGNWLRLTRTAPPRAPDAPGLQFLSLGLKRVQ